MQKIFLAFGLVGLGAMSASFAACSSSSSDDSTTVTDSGPGDTSIPTDTGVADTGPADTGTCATCSQLLAQGVAAGTPCATTTPILENVLMCICTTTALTSGGQGLCDGTQPDGGDAGDTSCSDLCANLTTAVPTAACQGCGATQCTSELTACQEDGNTGTPDAGTDAGDGG